MYNKLFFSGSLLLVALGTLPALAQDTLRATAGQVLTPARPMHRASPELAIEPERIIRSYFIELPFNKTVSIIFPSPVKSVDLGSRSIIADKAADVENVLKVKATQMGFNETNFSVITADGKFYSFVAGYNEAAPILALNLAYKPTGSNSASQMPSLPGMAQPSVDSPRVDSPGEPESGDGKATTGGKAGTAPSRGELRRRARMARRELRDKDAENLRLAMAKASEGGNAQDRSLATGSPNVKTDVDTVRLSKPVVVLVPTPAGTPSGGNEASIALAARTAYINGNNAKDGAIVFSGVRALQAQVVKNCERIMVQNRNVKHLGVVTGLMQATVKGVYVKDNVMYYRIAVANRSNINYDVDFIRFFITDKSVTKLTSRQEIEVVPFYVFREGTRTIAGKSAIERIYCFQRFTIPNDKRLLVEAGEVNGGRSLSFVINNADIMNADGL